MPQDPGRTATSTDDATVERFQPTSGRVVGGILVGLAVLVVATRLLQPDAGLADPLVAGAVLLGVLGWAASLRPAVWVTQRELVLRGMVDTVRIPLAAVERVVVRQVLSVHVDDKRYVSAAIGRTFRQVRSAQRAARPDRLGRKLDPVPEPKMTYADYVEQRIDQLAAEARRHAPAEGERSGVRRRPAWVEIALIVGATAALLVTVVA